MAVVDRHIIAAVLWQGAKDLYLLTRFSAIGYSILLPLLGAASVGPTVDGGSLLGLVGVAIAFHVFAYVFNDVVDLDIDRTEPLRADYPLVRGSIGRGAALALAFAQIPVAVVLTALLDGNAAAFGSLAAAFGCMTLYDLYGKRLTYPILTDVVQGVGWAALAVYGASVASGRPSGLTLILAGMVATYTLLINGVHGALRDLENDRRRGARTTAIVLGARANRQEGYLLPASLKAYALLLQLLLIGFGLVPLIAGLGGVESGRWWTVAATLIVADTGALWLLYHAARAQFDKWNLLFYGMLHLVVSLATLALPFVLYLGRTAFLVALAAYIIPIVSMWAYGGLRWDS